jgi:hypothetical protein
MIQISDTIADEAKSNAFPIGPILHQTDVAMDTKILAPSPYISTERNKKKAIKNAEPVARRTMKIVNVIAILIPDVKMTPFLRGFASKHLRPTVLPAIHLTSCHR